MQSRPRVLVTCFPQSGHLHPLIPTARALAEAGCPVLVATSAAEHPVLAAAGLEGDRPRADLRGDGYASGRGEARKSWRQLHRLVARCGPPLRSPVGTASAL